MIEQVLGEVGCPSCSERVQVKERPVVRYVDLPVYGTPMRLHGPGQRPLNTAPRIGSFAVLGGPRSIQRTCC